MLLVYDLELKRPGGPVLQMLQSGNLDAMRRFPEHLWLHEITPGLNLWTVAEQDDGRRESVRRDQVFDQRP